MTGDELESSPNANAKTEAEKRAIYEAHLKRLEEEADLMARSDQSRNRAIAKVAAGGFAAVIAGLLIIPALTAILGLGVIAFFMWLLPCCSP